MALNKAYSSEIDPITGLEVSAPYNAGAVNYQLQYKLSPKLDVEVPNLFEKSSEYDNEALDYNEVQSNPDAVALNRHEQQPWYEQLGNSVTQAIVGSIAGQTMEGAGYLLDIPQYLDIAKGTEKEFGNWFSDLGKSLNTWAQENAPIYQDPNKQGGFHPEEMSWWASNFLPSVVSTLSLLIPSGAAVKALGYLGKGLASAARIGEISQLSGKAAWAAKGLTQSVVSRHMENIMEAASVGEEIKRLAGLPLNSEQVNKIKANYGIDVPLVDLPDGAGTVHMLDDSVANEIAARASANSYRSNWAMLAQDIPQYLLLNTPFGKATAALTVKAAKLLGKDATPIVTKKLGAIGLDMIGQGGEEMYQYGVSERSKELAMVDAGLIDKRDLSDAVKGYLKSGEFWSSGFFGAIGAGAVQTVGKGINRAITRINGLQTTDEKRVADIESWSSKLQHYNDALLAAEQTGDQDTYNNVQNEFKTDFAIQLAKNGNLGHFVDMVNGLANATEEEQQSFAVSPEIVAQAKSNSPELIADIQSIGKSFEYFNNKFSGDTNLASEATRADFEIKNYSKKLDTANSSIASTIAQIPISSTGKESLQLRTEKTQLDKLISHFDKHVETVQNPLMKEYVQEKLDLLNTRRATVESKLSDLEYSQEEREVDLAAYNGMAETDRHDAVSNIDKSVANKIYYDLSLNVARATQKKYADPEWVKSRKKIIRDNIKSQVKDVVKDAKTPQDIDDMEARANTPEDKKIVKDVINKAAEAQTIVSPKSNVGSVAESVPGVPTITQEIPDDYDMPDFSESINDIQSSLDSAIDPQSEAELEEEIGIVKSIVAAQEAINISERYSGSDGVALYNRELKQITDEINSALDTILSQDQASGWRLRTKSQLFLQGLNESGPEEFEHRVKLLIEDASNFDKSNNDRISPLTILKIINNVHSNSQELASGSNTGVALSQLLETTPAPTADVETGFVTPEMDNRPFSVIRNDIPYTTESGNQSTYERIEIINGPLTVGNLILPTKPGKTLIANQDFLDKGDIKFGTKVYIEYTPDDVFFEDNPNTRGFKTVIYKDNVVKPENRIVVGVLNTTTQKNLTTNERNALETLRSKLAEEFNSERTKALQLGDKATPIQSKYYLTSVGIIGEYSNTGIKSKPLDVLPLSTNIGEYAQKGGFILGYTNHENVLEFTGCSVDIPVLSNVMSGAGEIIVGVPNPSIPGDTLIVRAFKPTLNEIAKTDPVLANNFADFAIEDFADILDRNGKKEAVQYLKSVIRLTDNKLSQAALTPLEDLKNPESEKYQALRANIMDSYVAINKYDINKVGVLPRPYGAGDDRVVTNTVLNKFIRVTLAKDKLFENVSLRVSLDFKDENDKSILDIKHIRKQYKPAIKAEVVTKQVDEVAPQAPIVEKTVVKGVSKAQLLGETSTVEASTPSTEPVKPLTKFDGLDGFKIDISDDFVGKSGKPKLKTRTDSFKFANKEEELAWVHKYFPKLDIRDLKEISGLIDEVTRGGKEAWGAFYNAAIYMSGDASKGTMYHEAFHAVFNLALNDKEREALLSTAQGDSILEKEEWLADRYMDYVISGQADKSLSTKIRRFFARLKALINSVFNNDVKNLSDLASRVDIGYYRNKVVTDSPFANENLRFRINGWTYAKEREAIDTVNNIIVTRILNGESGLRAMFPEAASMTNAELMNFIFKKTNDKLFFHKLTKNAIVDQYEKSTDDATKSALYELADALFTSDNKPKDLVVLSLKGLARNGIIVTNRGAENSIEDIDNILEEEHDSPSSDKQAFGINFTNKSARIGASQMIKDVIRYLPTGEVNYFGFTKYADFDTTYNTIYKDLAGVTSVNEIAQYLKDLLPIRPEYQTLIDKMRDRQFATDMLVAFSRAYLPHTMMSFEANTYDMGGIPITDKYYKVGDANRAGLVQSIISNWSNGVLFNSDVVERNVDGSIVIDRVKASELMDEYNAIVRKQIDALTDVDFNALSSITKQFGFDVSANTFKYINSMKPGKRSKMLIGDKSIRTIINKFTEGFNPFDTTAGIDVSEQASIRLLANVAKNANTDLFETSFIDANKNKVFSHVIPTFLSTLMHDLHNPNLVSAKIAKYRQDGLYKDNVILNTLEENSSSADSLKDALSFTAIAGYDDSTGVATYANMTPSQLKGATLHLYYNGGNSTHSLFRLPPLSDSGNMLAFKFKRMSIDKAYTAFIKQAGHEYNKISQFANPEYYGNKVKNYNNDTNKNTETGYTVASMFNGFDGNPALNSNKNKALDVLDNYFNNYVELYYKSLVNSGVVVTVGDKLSPKSKLDTRLLKSVEDEVSGFKDYLKTFLVNDELLRGQFSIMLAGDPAFYKESNGKQVDYVKRFKEIFSPHQIPDTSAIYTRYDKITKDVIGEPVRVPAMYNSIYLKDVEIPSVNISNEFIDGLVEDGIITKHKALQLKVGYGAIENDNGKRNLVNVTDAQAWINLDMYRKTMVSYNRWTDAHEEAYPRLLRGEGTGNDIALVMQPLKTFMYTMVYDEKLGRMMPIQHKNSELLLLPQMANNNPKLKAVLDYMNNNNIGIVNFESAVKAGLSGAVSIDDIIANPNVNVTIHSIPTVDRGIQMETTQHYKDTMNLFATQIRKIIIADLVEGHDYVITPGSGIKPLTLKADQLVNLYESIIIQNLKDAYNELKDEFTVDGQLDWKKVHAILAREGISRNKGEDFEKAIAYVESTGKLALPLFHPMHSETMQSLMTSIFRNNVTKQKISGGAFILATSVGLSRELKLVFNNASSRKKYEDNLEVSKESVIFSESLWNNNKDSLLVAYPDLTVDDFRKLSMEEQERLINCNK